MEYLPGEKHRVSPDFSFSIAVWMVLGSLLLGATVALHLLPASPAPVLPPDPLLPPDPVVEPSALASLPPEAGVELLLLQPSASAPARRAM
jgi:hypothetical protein